MVKNDYRDFYHQTNALKTLHNINLALTFDLVHVSVLNQQQQQTINSQKKKLEKCELWRQLERLARLT